MNIKEISHWFLGIPVVALGVIPGSENDNWWVTLADGRIIRMSVQNPAEEIGNLGLSPLNDALCMDMESLIVGVGGGGIRIYDIDQADLFEPCPDIYSNIYKVCYVSEMEIVCGGSDEILWEVKLSNCQKRSLCDIGEGLYSLSVSPRNGDVLYSSGGGGGCYVALLEPSGKRTIISLLEMQKVTASFDMSGGYVIQLDKYARCIDLINKKNVWTLSDQELFLDNPNDVDWNHSCQWSNPIFSSDCNNVIIGSGRGFLYVLNLTSPEIIFKIEAHCNHITHLFKFSEGRYIVSCDDKGIIKLWEVYDT